MFYFRIRTVTLNLPLLTTTVRLSLRRSSDVSGGRGRAPGGGEGGPGRTSQFSYYNYGAHNLSYVKLYPQDY